MKLLVDNQLPLALAAFLRQRGHQCCHVIDLGLDEATDVQVWNRCVLEGWVLISKDEDFLFLAKRPGDTGRLIWVRLGNCRNPALVEAFARANDDLISAFDEGQRVVEIR